MSGCPKLWSLFNFWVPNKMRHLLSRVPQKGALILTTTHMYSLGLMDPGLGFEEWLSGLSFRQSSLKGVLYGFH